MSRNFSSQILADFSNKALNKEVGITYADLVELNRISDTSIKEIQDFVQENIARTALLAPIRLPNGLEEPAGKEWIDRLAAIERLAAQKESITISKSEVYTKTLAESKVKLAKLFWEVRASTTSGSPAILAVAEKTTEAAAPTKSVVNTPPVVAAANPGAPAAKSKTDGAQNKQASTVAGKVENKKIGMIDTQKIKYSKDSLVDIDEDHFDENTQELILWVFSKENTEKETITAIKALQIHIGLTGKDVDGAFGRGSIAALNVYKAKPEAGASAAGAPVVAKPEVGASAAGAPAVAKPGEAKQKEEGMSTGAKLGLGAAVLVGATYLGRKQIWNLVGKISWKEAREIAEKEIAEKLAARKVNEEIAGIKNLWLNVFKTEAIRGDQIINNRAFTKSVDDNGRDMILSKSKKYPPFDKIDQNPEISKIIKLEQRVKSWRENLNQDTVAEKAKRTEAYNDRKKDPLIADIEKDIAYNKANNLPVKDLEAKLTSELAAKSISETATKATVPSFSSKAKALDWWNGLSPAKKVIYPVGTIITISGLRYCTTASGTLERTNV